eukprot:15289612-Ditylum_brightwellii.AAC.1
MHKYYVETPDGEGVIAVPESLEDDETIPDIVTADRAHCQLKHMLPNINNLKNWRLTNEMKNFLQAEMEVEMMDDKLLEFW